MTAANTPWIWLSGDVMYAVHEEQLAEHGGGSGLRNPGLFESALARPQQLAAYGTPDVAAVAAAYGFGIAENHHFLDGNKRTAFVAVELFLALNGCTLTADDADCVLTMQDLASGALDEAAFADWIRAHVAPR
jgi:death-on-curing protein